jgi:hypothetical protein
MPLLLLRPDAAHPGAVSRPQHVRVSIQMARDWSTEATARGMGKGISASGSEEDQGPLFRRTMVVRGGQPVA